MTQQQNGLHGTHHQILAMDIKQHQHGKKA